MTNEPIDEQSSQRGCVMGCLGVLAVVGGGILGGILGGIVGDALASPSANELLNNPFVGLRETVQGGIIGGVVGLTLVAILVAKFGPKHMPAPEGPAIDPLVSKALSSARVPDGGLPARSVPNRNAARIGRSEGGLVVRVVERSGIWARIDADGSGPVWVEAGALEPVEDAEEDSGQVKDGE